MKRDLLNIVLFVICRAAALLRFKKSKRNEKWMCGGGSSYHLVMLNNNQN